MPFKSKDFDPNAAVELYTFAALLISVKPLSLSSVALLLSKFNNNCVALSPMSIPWVPYTELGKVKALGLWRHLIKILVCCLHQ